MIKRAYGFTIVELLIVIVVIAILAAIGIVAYSGIQERAKYSSSLGSLQQVKKVVDMYYADKGQYPHSGTLGISAWRFSCASSDSIWFVPDISEYATSFPVAPCGDMPTTNNDSWIYLSNGTSYKLLYIRAKVSNTFRDLVPSEMRDPVRWNSSNSITWGYWSSGGQSL